MVKCNMYYMVSCNMYYMVNSRPQVCPPWVCRGPSGHKCVLRGCVLRDTSWKCIRTLTYLDLLVRVVFATPSLVRCGVSGLL